MHTRYIDTRIVLFALLIDPSIGNIRALSFLVTHVVQDTHRVRDSNSAPPSDREQCRPKTILCTFVRVLFPNLVPQSDMGNCRALRILFSGLGWLSHVHDGLANSSPPS